MLPTISEALKELEIAGTKNPGPWTKHSENTGLAAFRITIISVNLPVVVCLKPATCSPVQMLERIVGFWFSLSKGSAVFFRLNIRFPLFLCHFKEAMSAAAIFDPFVECEWFIVPRKCYRNKRTYQALKRKALLD